MALSLVAWAQETPTAPAPNSTPAPQAKSCCHHAMDAKGGMSCQHASADAKDAAGCCGMDKNKCEMKDGKSCCAAKDVKAQMKQCKKHGGCKDGKCCGMAGDKSAMNCCGNKCERHEHATSAG